MTGEAPFVVVGAGAAGLAAGTALAESGAPVLVLEASKQLGGRARSYVDRATGCAVDNGQHALMGCYHEFLGLLERIGKRDALFESELRIPFWSATRGLRRLDCPAWPAPAHFAAGLLRYGQLAPRERLSALAAGLRLVARYGRDGRPDANVARALEQLGQGSRARAALWDPLVVATLNADPARSSARLLAEVVKRALLSSREGSRFLLPALPLSELYAEPARKYVEERGGLVRTSARVDAIEIENGRAVGLRLGDERIAAAGVVVAVPPAALARIATAADSCTAAGGLAPPPALETATPIVSVTLFLDRHVEAPPFVGLVERETQWIFQLDRIQGRRDPARHGETGTDGARIACVKSAADEWTRLPREVIAERAWRDVCAALPDARGARVRHAVVVKEVAATLAPEPALQPLRPGISTRWPNVWRAGDWTATGLPATLESAALSGHRAAAAALSETGSLEEAA